MLFRIIKIWRRLFLSAFALQSQPPKAETDEDAEIGEAAARRARLDQTSKPEVSENAMMKLMWAHASLLSQLGRYENSVYYYERAAMLDNSPYLARYKLANAYFKSGRFPEAKSLAEKLILEKTDAQMGAGKLHRIIAAIEHFENHQGAGQARMRNYYHSNPNEVTLSHNRDAPRILRTMGFHHCFYMPARQAKRGYTVRLRGGHFAATYLMDMGQYNINTYVINKGNISSIPPIYSPAVDSDTKPNLILNSIADPDLEGEALTALDTYLSDKGTIAVINPPQQVMKTTRDGNYQRLNSLDGIRFGKTLRFRVADQARDDLLTMIEGQGYTYPFILRSTGEQTARTTKLLHSRKDAQQYLTANTSPELYAIEFVPNASDQGHYTKMRFFCIDGALYPVVHHIDQVWNVHGSNRKSFMSAHPWMLEKEQQFLANPRSVIGDSAYTRLEKLYDVIKLDFFGFDFTQLSDGTLLIFELNPAMRHSFDHADNFPYMKPHMQAITDAFTAMINQRCG